MSDLENRVGHLEIRMDTTEDRVANTEGIVDLLKKDVAEIKAMLPRLATKDDIHKITEKIDRDINGLLRDALSSVPGRQAALWAAVSGVGVAVGTIITIFHLIQH